MTRQLLCRKCGEPKAIRPMHMADALQGWKIRSCYVLGVAPKDHGIRVNGVFSPCPLQCDDCCAPIHGEICVAITMWRGEGEPRMWEPEFGTVLEPVTVEAADKLSKDHE